MSTRHANQHDQIERDINQNMLTWTETIDPSQSSITEEHDDFINYLKERYLTIDIFDGQTQFYFGSCKIPLFEYLRQGKDVITKAKECEIFDPVKS